MSQPEFDAEIFNGEIRKFLKKVGITSQIEMERAVREALEKGALDPSQTLHARLVLEIPGVGLRHEVVQDLVLSQ
jgi:hypothetical protein